MKRQLLSVEEYLDEALGLVRPDERVEQIVLAAAGGRVLAAPVASLVSIPVFDNSAMDGYAVRFAEVSAVSARLRVVGDVPAGSAEDPVAGIGECVRIMTGAALPSFADTVVPVEDTETTGDTITILTVPAKSGRHVRRAGEDVAAGAVLAEAGTVLTPAVIGALAAGGVAEVPVRPRPVVAVAATGDELAAPGDTLARGQIYESNSVTLAGLLSGYGAVVDRADPIPDCAEALVAWLNRAAETADLIVLTGGASVGAYDVVRDVLTEAGGSFRHVRMQPGKPQGWGLWQGVPVLALPGNPVSAALSCELFVTAVLDRILGRAGAVELTAVAGTDWDSPAGRRQYIAVRLGSDAAGRLIAVPNHARGSASHLVTSLAGADGIGIVAEELSRVSAGDLLRVRRLR